MSAGVSSKAVKNLMPSTFRPLLWMIPGFAFTVFAYWYPTWVDRGIPQELDSRIWVLVAFALRYTLLAAATVLIAYGFLLRAAFRDRSLGSVIAVGSGLLMFLPSVWLVATIGIAWISR